MELPIIVDAKGDLLVFDSVQALSAYIEPIDVEAGEYPQTFDAKGRPLEIAIEGKRTFLGDTRVVVVKPLNAPPAPQKLARIIIEFLTAVGENVTTEPTLDELVQRLDRFRTV